MIKDWLIVHVRKTLMVEHTQISADGTLKAHSAILKIHISEPWLWGPPHEGCTQYWVQYTHMKNTHSRHTVQYNNLAEHWQWKRPHEGWIHKAPSTTHSYEEYTLKAHSTIQSFSWTLTMEITTWRLNPQGTQ